MTEVRDAIIFVEFCPSPSLLRPTSSPDATMLNYLNDRERGAPLSFIGFCPPPPDTTILLTKRGAGITLCRILAPPPPTTQQYLTKLMTERGAPLSFVGLCPPLPQTPQYLTILMTLRGGGANIL